ncbi:MAG: hypothetical protein GXO46_06035 [Chlorobi bacterium]|uniref:Bacteriocin n=1 Tax=Chryseobacterium urinae TaxID=3058400 RepID=A0ABT8U6M2_9FLAO|nr:hypothetical protein [Chryseobacterium sp. APV1]MDO3426707.1 hypothetical protein [Chryseobacterium sp. APV1]NPA08527.1 hypothetical protein [Chlorobiota bacterium]
MKNLKKLSRPELRAIEGSGPNWSCTPTSCPKGSCCIPGIWPTTPRACVICADS